MLGVIVVAGLIVGLETSPTIEAQYGAWLHTIDSANDQNPTFEQNFTQT